MCSSLTRVLARRRVAVLATALLMASLLAPALPASASTSAAATLASPVSVAIAQAVLWMTGMMSPSTSTVAAPQPAPTVPTEWTSDKDPDGHQ
jgi:hypothetical protein